MTLEDKIRGHFNNSLPYGLKKKMASKLKTSRQTLAVWFKQDIRLRNFFQRGAIDQFLNRWSKKRTSKFELNQAVFFEENLYTVVSKGFYEDSYYYTLSNSEFKRTDLKKESEIEGL